MALCWSEKSHFFFVEGVELIGQVLHYRRFANRYFGLLSAGVHH